MKKHKWTSVDQASTPKLQNVKIDKLQIWETYHCKEQWANDKRKEHRQWWPYRPVSKEEKRAQMFKKSFKVKQNHWMFKSRQALRLVQKLSRKAMTAGDVAHFLHPNRTAMLNQNILSLPKNTMMHRVSFHSTSYAEPELELGTSQQFVQ